MKITKINVWTEKVPLKCTFKISYKSISDTSFRLIKIETSKGMVGYGSASPSPSVTGETMVMCEKLLNEDSLSWLIGQDIRYLQSHLKKLHKDMINTPSALCAVDSALHDLMAQYLGIPLVKMLGQAHNALPTSLTIGIMSVEETIERAKEYISNGCKVLKIKLGINIEEDIERLNRLRETVGEEVKIRVDPNQGYSYEETLHAIRVAETLQIEFLEQPMKQDMVEDYRKIPDRYKYLICCDETLLNEKSAIELAYPPKACGIYNLKLMKCGGIHRARIIAAIAQIADMDLMWGCNAESVISITSAIHVAYSCPNTRYIDLDGSFYLSYDLADDGFVYKDGYLYLTNKPGLGLSWKNR